MVADPIYHAFMLTPFMPFMRGEGNPSLQTLHKIAKALDLSLQVSMR